MRRPRGELVAYAALVVIAIVLRFIDLGDRPFHHDESQDAYFSWLLYTHPAQFDPANEQLLVAAGRDVADRVWSGS